MLTRRAGRSSNEDEDSLEVNLMQTESSPDRSRQASSGEGLVGDRGNIALLLFLYVLQGIPLGLGGSLPYILQNRKISYKDQAIFSFAHWPFSLKLLWAPVVDALYVSAFGRRKSWLVPTQYLIGIFMIVLSSYINQLLGEGSDQPPSVFILTSVFFCMNFLAATQDIAVDGWALTMLSRRNVGYASTCNSVGQTAGYFIGNVVLLALESPSFSNSYLRSTPQEQGVITISGFMFFWGVVFLVTTTLVMILKGEREDPPQEGILGTYQQLIRVFCLPSVLNTVAILLTCKIAFAATDGVTSLKLIETGIPKEQLALLAVPMIPVQVMLPILISSYTSGPRPLDVFLKAYTPRLLFGIIFVAVVWWTPQVRSASGTFPMYYYCLVIIIFALQQVTVYGIYVALMAFFARVSDPTIGGTYMTLLNTICNLGGNWPYTLALWSVDYLTYKSCLGSTVTATHGSCSTDQDLQVCTEAGGTCQVTLDGYYVETLICTSFGFLWLAFARSRINYLQRLPAHAWSTTW